VTRASRRQRRGPISRPAKSLQTGSFGKRWEVGGGIGNLTSGEIVRIGNVVNDRRIPRRPRQARRSGRIVKEPLTQSYAERRTARARDVHPPHEVLRNVGPKVPKSGQKSRIFGFAQSSAGARVGGINPSRSPIRRQPITSPSTASPRPSGNSCPRVHRTRLGAWCGRPRRGCPTQGAF